jgi:hypothetical protein
MIAWMLACPMCFGAADSEQVHAAKLGVLVMLGFIVPLLVAIALIARSWAKRARALDSGLLRDHELGEKREPLAGHPQPSL